MFRIPRYSGIDKSFIVRDDELDITMMFDYDDVWHDRQDLAAKLIRDILNQNLELIAKRMNEFDHKGHE